VKKAFLVLITIALVVGLSLSGIIPVAAQEPHEGPTVWPQPITDPAKAVPFSHPLGNTCNPDSPYYNPNDRYGAPGSRFGPPGQRSLEFPIPGIGDLGPGHRAFGTIISTYTDVNYAYAHHRYFYDLSIPSGTSLYAPTLLKPDSAKCPLEILTRYWVSSGTMKRHIAVYNHVTGQFNSSTPIVSEYLSNGFYACETLKYGSTWYAMLYNFSDGQWETWATETRPRSGTEYRGWNIWEEYNFDESNWPSLGGLRLEAKDILINITGVGDRYVTSSYGYQVKNVGSAPYSFKWVNKYYRWYVQ